MNITIPAGSEFREKLARNIAMEVMRLDVKKPWLITIKEKRPNRSAEQNRLLWQMYTEILEVGGEAMRGYTKAELHEFFLGDHFGIDERIVFGEAQYHPRNRSRNLSKKDFSEFVESIVRFMANQGVVLTMPEDL